MFTEYQHTNDCRQRPAKCVMMALNEFLKFKKLETYNSNRYSETIYLQLNDSISQANSIVINLSSYFIINSSTLVNFLSNQNISEFVNFSILHNNVCVSYEIKEKIKKVDEWFKMYLNACSYY